MVLSLGATATGAAATFVPVGIVVVGHCRMPILQILISRQGLGSRSCD